MAKVTIQSIINGECSSSSCFHNHTGVCAITDDSQMKVFIDIMVQHIDTKPHKNAKWDCTRYENERSKR